MLEPLCTKHLIVNADDFGLSRGINRGVVAAHQQGLVTSASLMVGGDAAIDAVEQANSCPSLALGLHIDLGEWRYRAGEWEPVYEVVSLEDLAAVESELTRQLDCFHDLVGRAPTHLDSHQHVHRDPGIGECMRQLAESLDIPLRHTSQQVQYCGRFYGQTHHGESQPAWVSEAALLTIIGGLPAGITEMACHPAFAVDFCSMYGVERLTELRSLCAPAVRKAVADHGITLCSFLDISALTVP